MVQFLVDCRGSLLKPFLNLLQRTAVAREFRLDRLQKAPHLIGPSLNIKRLKTHSKAIEDCGQGCRPGNNHASLSLQPFDKSRSPQDLCVKPLSRQIHNREFGCSRWRNILFLYVARTAADPL